MKTDGLICDDIGTYAYSGPEAAPALIGAILGNDAYSKNGEALVDLKTSLVDKASCKVPQ